MAGLAAEATLTEMAKMVYRVDKVEKERQQAVLVLAVAETPRLKTVSTELLAREDKGGRATVIPLPNAVVVEVEAEGTTAEEAAEVLGTEVEAEAVAVPVFVPGRAAIRNSARRFRQKMDI